MPGAGGVGALVEAGAEAVEALEQGAVAARVAAAELGVAAAEGEAPRRPERRLEIQALRVRPRRPRGERRRQQQRQGRPWAPHGAPGHRGQTELPPPCCARLGRLAPPGHQERGKAGSGLSDSARIEAPSSQDPAAARRACLRPWWLWTGDFILIPPRAQPGRYLAG